MPLPEERARQNIDQMLQAAGWVVQDREALNLKAARGVAVREFPLKTGEADYLLFVDRKAIGAIEAKPEGTTLSGISHQSEKYSSGLLDVPPAWRKPLPFLYESTGVETYFTDGLDPEPRSRRVFHFHRPETLAEWVQEPSSLRARLRELPDCKLNKTGLWDAQVEAITNLEHSLADDRPRALVQMATGSGKTFTAVSSIYRLIKFGGARRVLFLVDRANLGRQTLKEFQQYETPDDGRKFNELYNVQHLQSNTLDHVSRVCITTIQRLYSILSGEPEYDPENEEGSLFELGDALDKRQPVTVSYNPTLPIEYFDFIVTDECHRSIYNLWRQALEYFDAFLVGLTATPSLQTLGFFNENLVMEYSRQRAVADGVNVDGEVYRIRTDIGEQGSKVDAGFWVTKRDKQTRKERLEVLDDDLQYDASQLDRQVVSPSQIRTVVRTYRDKLPEIFPGRTEVPKTLVFAKDDSHAETIVGIMREEFAKGNNFCKKITYRVSGIKPENLIAEFRNDYYPRIAVTVDMIATGTDIKPLEALLFMRPVKSRVLFEQMLGRGTRIISSTDLQAVTPDALMKTHFVIIDAVGVVEQAKVDTQTLERKRLVTFPKLLESVALGARDEDSLLSLAGRLARLARTITPQENYDLSGLAGGRGPRELANALIDAFDPERQYGMARVLARSENPTDGQIQQAAEKLAEDAAAPFDDPALRRLLIDIQQRNEQVIDIVSVDKLRVAEFSQSDTERARATVEGFRQFIEENRDEITALRIIYNRPYAQRRLTYDDISALAERIKQPPRSWTPDNLWQAYARLERDKVRGTGEKRLLADLVSLVRHAAHPEDELVPYPDLVRTRYDQWLSAQEVAGKAFTPEQRWWLDRIAEYIGVNLGIAPDDLANPPFFDKGGQIAAARVFGQELPALLDELNGALVA
jgi:type I restriction enzyme R subunit